MGASNLQLECGNREWYQIDNPMTASQEDWHIKRCPPRTIICGLETRVQEKGARDDESALNGLRVKCCDEKIRSQVLRLMG